VPVPAKSVDDVNVPSNTLWKPLTVRFHCMKLPGG
jgi:hypothetical protein